MNGRQSLTIAAVAALSLAGCGQGTVSPATTTTSAAPASTAPASTSPASATPSASASAPSSAAPTPSTTTAAPSASATSVSALTERYCLPTEKLCFNYPAGWTFQTSTLPAQNGFPAHDHAELKNAQGKTVYVVESGVQGIGGGCGPEVMRTNSVLHVDDSKLGGYQADVDTLATAKISRTVVSNADGTFTPFTFLTVKTGYATVGQVKDCPGLLANVVPVRPGADWHQGGVATGEEGFLAKPSNRQYPTQDAAAAYFDTTDAKTIVAILQTAVYSG